MEEFTRVCICLACFIQVTGVHHLDFTLITVRGDTHIAADHVLKAYEDLEFLDGFLVVEVFMIVGSDTSYRQLQGISVDLLMDGRYLEAEHHPLVVDGFIRIQELIHGLVDCFGNSAFDDMTYPDLRVVDALTPEKLLCRFMDCFYKGRV